MNNPLEHEAGEISTKDELIETHSEKLFDHFLEIKDEYEDPITFEEWLDRLDSFELKSIID